MLPMGVLYGGRIGVAALGLLVLPWLSAIMPPDQFGLAATVIALQSLAVVLDLGVSVTIAREFPVLVNGHDHRALMKRSERVLLLIYAPVAAIAGISAATGILPVSVPIALLVCLSLLLIVWQNIIVVAFISRQRYLTSTLSQFTSLLLRHGFSLALVVAIAGSVEIFVLGQVVGAAIMLGVSRIAFFRQHPENDDAAADHVSLSRTANVAVMIYTIAGACAMQLDKVLLSALASPADTGPYFLASMLSLVPITFLASPVAQFVQPKLIACLAARQSEDARRWISRLTLAIIVLAVLPGIALSVAAPWLVPLWLHGSPHQITVSHYAMLLLPGASIGALGLVPAIVLIARRDYRAMATISCVLAVAVLTATAFLADRDAIARVCIAYALYHVLAAIALWWRAARIEPCIANVFAIKARTANDQSEKAT